MAAHWGQAMHRPAAQAVQHVSACAGWARLRWCCRCWPARWPTDLDGRTGVDPAAGWQRSDRGPGAGTATPPVDVAVAHGSVGVMAKHAGDLQAARTCGCIVAIQAAGERHRRGEVEPARWRSVEAPHQKGVLLTRELVGQALRRGEAAALREGLHHQLPTSCRLSRRSPTSSSRARPMARDAQGTHPGPHGQRRPQPKTLVALSLAKVTGSTHVRLR